MPFLAFDLDAMPQVPRAARAAGVPEGAIAWGLLQCWEYCWRKKTAIVTTLQLKGFFGSDVADALHAFGFTTPTDGGHRVHGAEKYLRIKKAQSEAGKANAGNLKQNRVKAPQPEPVSEQDSGPEPEDLTGSSRKKSPALSVEQLTVDQSSIPAVDVATGHRRPKRETIPPSIVPPDTPPEAWLAEDFWRWFQGKRQEVGFFPEPLPNGRQLSSWYSEALSAIGGDVAALQEAVYGFGNHKHWQNAKPPLPFGAFMSEWSKFLPRRHRAGP